MADFKLKRGYDLRLDGESEKTVVSAARPSTVAVKPVAFRGIKPTLLVAEGTDVVCGTPLFCDKSNRDHIFTSPATGKITEIQRGPRRVIEQIVVETAEQPEAIEYATYAPEQLKSLSRDEVLRELMKSGMLALFRQRPFDYVADPEVVPRDIFVSAFDSAPLAPDQALLIKGNEAYFQAGIDIASVLTTGRVHVSIRRDTKDSSPFSSVKNAEIHRFSGPHPSGCVGIQIHHIAPINGRDDQVWYITPQCLVMLGKLFINGKIAPEVVVSLAGTAVVERMYYRTVIGANVSSIVQGNVQTGSVRHISGNVLTGTSVKSGGHLGFYDSMLTVIPESTGPELVGWMRPGFGKDSFYRTFVSPFIPGLKFAPDTKLNGGVRAFVATGYYDQVLPMNLYPVFLVKSILAGDIEEMEGLGIYEVTEEELALCEYICPSKMDIQKILRGGLDLIEKEG